MTAWKHLERQVAKYFSTARRKRGDDFSQSDVEILADINNWLNSTKYPGYIIGECKYRSTGLGVVDTYIENKSKEKISIGLIGEGVLITNLNNFKDVFLEIYKGKGVITDTSKYHTFSIKKSIPKYIHEFFKQARDYSSIISKEVTIPSDGVVPCLPVLCFAKRSRQGIYILFRIEDFQSFLQASNNT